jgi:hypothetical protein
MEEQKNVITCMCIITHASYDSEGPIPSLKRKPSLNVSALYSCTFGHLDENISLLFYASDGLSMGD